MSLLKDLKQEESTIVKVKDIIEDNFEVIKKYSDTIERQYSKDLDMYVDKIKSILTKIRNKELVNYSDDYLELQIIALPTVLYDIIEDMEDLGSKQDMSKIHKDERYAEVFSGILEGTIPDKESRAKRETVAETIMVEIYKRAYGKLKKKFEVAQELHGSLKKAMDNRIKNKEVFRRDNVTANMNDEMNLHEEV